VKRMATATARFANRPPPGLRVASRVDAGRAISEEDLQELERLRAYHKRELMKASHEQTTLEQDVDAPIRRCVMAFALLGCDPQWSCCGFDYAEQPIHKWHFYGNVFFMLRDCAKTRDVVAGFLPLANGDWKAETGVVPATGVPKLDLFIDIARPDQWADKDCPHYPEPAVFNIALLENYLMSRSREFTDQVVLHDTNRAYKGIFQNWQYPAKGDWLIRKSDLLDPSAARVDSGPADTSAVGTEETSIGISANPTRVAARDSVVLRGALTPGRSGDTCIVEVKRPGAKEWSRVSATLTSNGDGEWSCRYTVPKRGNYQFRVRFEGDCQRVPATSRQVTVVAR
jgi:hypothetical protein